MKCERCGADFHYKSHLKRHLQLKKECPITFSIADRTYLLKTLDDNKVDNSYSCTCGKTYKHATSLYHHRAKCDKYTKSSNTGLRKEINNLKKEIAELKSTSAPPNITNIARDQNITNNSITNNFNLNLQPWNPSNFDYSRLNNDNYDQAFEANNQVETLVKFALKSPNNHVFIISKNNIPMFFNGTSFAEIPDGVRQTYAAFFSQLKTYSLENESRMRDLFNNDAYGFYDDHMDRLNQSEDLDDHTALVEVIKKNTDKILKTHALEL